MAMKRRRRIAVRHEKTANEILVKEEKYSEMKRGDVPGTHEIEKWPLRDCKLHFREAKTFQIRISILTLMSHENAPDSAI
jgi:hypothetical protein